MPKKIDDILNPKPAAPPERHTKIMRALGEATSRGDALTFTDILSRVEALPAPTTGGLGKVAWVALGVLDHAAGGHEKRKAECREALAELVSVGHVVADKSGGETYYWLQRWA